MTQTLIGSVEADLSAPSPNSQRDTDDKYYELVSGGSSARLLEGFLDFQLPELLAAEGPLSAKAICERYALHPTRGWKFLHLLAMMGLLVETGGDRGDDGATYALSEQSKRYFGQDGAGGYFYRDLLNFHRAVDRLPLVDVLRGLPLPAAVQWPPPGLEAAEHLELWMRVSAAGAVECLVASQTMAGVKTLLDVGGGDGTIGCTLADRYPDLAVTVFNLPASAYIARRTIAERKQTARVKVHEGDFLKDELPGGGFERVMFSRVLADWTPNVCAMLLAKARRALAPGGRVIISEPLTDGNTKMAIAWEYRYMFYDTFGRVVYKPLRLYRDLLKEAGLEIVKISPMTDDGFYTVIEAAATS